MIRKCILVLAGMVLGMSGLIGAVSAALPPLPQMNQDLKPLSGVVIMAVGDEFLIDQDAATGISAGDLFAVIRPGEKIVHPVTKAVLGSLDEVQAVLKITRTKSGYAYARPLGAATGVKRGDPVRRFSAIPAVFWDYCGAGAGALAELKKLLPELDWQDYDQAQLDKPARPGAVAGKDGRLLFVCLGNRLEVRDGTFELLRSYAWPSPVASEILTAPSVSARGAAEAAPPAMSVAPVSAIPPAKPASPIVSVAPAEVVGITAAAPVIQAAAAAGDQAWVGPAVKGEAAGVEVGDFDGDGQQEIAVLYQRQIQVRRLTQGAAPLLATIEFGPSRKGVALDGADLDGDGRSELYVTAADGGDLASFVAVCRDGNWHLAQEGISWYFRTLPLPGEGRVLLAQRMGFGVDDFIGSIFRVKAESGRLVEGDPVPMPKRVDLFSVLPFADPSGQPRFAFLTDIARLRILDGSGESLWENSDVVGGSEIYIEREDPTKALQFPDRTRNLFIKPHMALGAQGEIVVPVNEGLRLFGRYRKFDSSHLLALSWDGQMIREVWKTRTEKGYLADFRLADADNDGKKEILLVLNYPTEGFSDNRKSVLMVYEMP